MRDADHARLTRCACGLRQWPQRKFLRANTAATASPHARFLARRQLVVCNAVRACARGGRAARSQARSRAISHVCRELSDKQSTTLPHAVLTAPQRNSSVLVQAATRAVKPAVTPRSAQLSLRTYGRLIRGRRRGGACWLWAPARQHVEERDKALRGDRVRGSGAWGPRGAPARRHVEERDQARAATGSEGWE